MGIKAGFRAAREMCGLSQQDVADDLQVSLKSVKRWEREDLPQYAVPEYALRYMDEQLGVFRRGVEASIAMFEAAAEEAESTLGNAELDAVQLVYYRNQEQMRSDGNDTRRVGQVNAVSRAAAAILFDMGVDVTFCYPEDEDRIAPR